MALPRPSAGVYSPPSRVARPGSLLDPTFGAAGGAFERFQTNIGGLPTGGTTNPNTGYGNNPNVGRGTDMYGGTPISLGNTLQSPLSPGGSFGYTPVSAPWGSQQGTSTGTGTRLEADPSYSGSGYDPDLSSGSQGNVPSRTSGYEPDLGGTAFGPGSIGYDPDLSSGSTGNVPTGAGGDADLGGLVGTAAGLLGGSTSKDGGLPAIGTWVSTQLIRIALIGAGLVLIAAAAWQLARQEVMPALAKAAR